MVFGRQERDGSGLRRLTTGMTAALLLAGCATNAPQAFANLTADEMQRIEDTCGQTLGAHRGDGYFEACRLSLAETIHRQDERRRLIQVRSDCVRNGLKEGSGELALCVLGANAPAADPARPVVDPPQQTSAQIKSLSRLSRDEAHRRVELSCATVGLDPSGAAFSDCVAELEASIVQADSPST